MCGIISVISNSNDSNLINDIYIGLIGIQHRGQDAVGICDDDIIIKNKGLVNDLFQNDEYIKHIHNTLRGRMLMGHVRYLTSGLNDDLSAQPLNLDIKYDDGTINNIKMCHNGNIFNTNDIIQLIKYNNDEQDCNTHTLSDTNLLLKLFASIIKKKKFSTLDNDEKKQTIYDVIHYFQSIIHGSFNLLIHIKDFGLIIVRDKYGIRPLSYAVKNSTYMFASEDNMYRNLNYKKINDIDPGQTIIYDYKTSKLTSNLYNKSELSPCLFEYIYLARADSNINGINVYHARQIMGEILGKHILKQLSNNLKDIDIIIPVPESGRIFAYGVQTIIKKPIVDALVKNRYINRTFIMENESKIINNIQNKFTVVNEMVCGKNILVVDDSIVRGNTSKIINKLFKTAGANKIYFASGSPKIYFPNYYGINIRTKTELVCHQKNDTQIANAINADMVIFNDLNNIVNELTKINPNIKNFELSMFNNQFIN